MPFEPKCWIARPYGLGGSNYTIQWHPPTARDPIVPTVLQLYKNGLTVSMDAVDIPVVVGHLRCDAGPIATVAIPSIPESVNEPSNKITEGS